MTEHADLAALRREYVANGLSESALAANPLVQLQRWLDEAIAAQVLDATAMALSTVSPAGVPSSRIVLLKKLDAQGLTFFTRYSSQKAREIESNARVALLFHWRELDRQVRIAGSAQATTREVSREYFQTRPRHSRLAARVSSGRDTVPDRATLERLFAEESQRHPGEEIPLPDDWGGYRVTVAEIEFWQGRENRLHDRLVYRAGTAPGSWVVTRLAP